MKPACDEILNVETAIDAFKNNRQQVTNQITTCFYSCYREGFIRWASIMYSQHPESLLQFIADTAFTDGVIKFRETAVKKGLYNSGASIKTILFNFFKNSLRDLLQQESRRFHKEKKRSRLQDTAEMEEKGEENQEVLYSSLEAALAKMEEQDRQIIEWRHLEEKSNDEIAQLLGISPASATNRIYRCMTRLRSLVQPTHV